MSQTDDEGGQREQQAPEEYNSVFLFFFEFIKPLLLELPCPNDRALAAVWIQKLQPEPATEEEKRLRADYLKLLLFVMQTGRLSGIFKSEPPSGPLPPFPDGASLTEMGNLLLDQAELQGSGDADGKKISYNVEISNDLREFVAAQEIPDFGIQMYYAWSADDPVSKWTLFDETKVPQHVRDKIRQLKMVKSEEGTSVKSGSVRGSKTDSSSRKTWYSGANEKCRVKVKSPEEIEKNLERRRHLGSNYPTQRGRARSRPADDECRWIPCGRFTAESSDRTSQREAGATKQCVQGIDVEGDSGDMMRAHPGGGSSPYSCDNAGLPKTVCCPQSNRKQDTDGSIRLQECDDAVDNRCQQVNDNSSQAGPSQRINDKCHGQEMNSELLRCGEEAGPSPSAQGYQMNQTVIAKPRRGTSPGQLCDNTQEDPSRRYSLSPQMRAYLAARSQGCPCPCPRLSKSQLLALRKRVRSRMEKSAARTKTLCPEPMPQPVPQHVAQPVPQKRAQEQYPQPVAKPMPRKSHPEVPEGCTCGDDRHKQQSGRSGRVKTNECVQEVPPQHQQQQYTSRRSDRRGSRPSEQPVPEQHLSAQTYVSTDRSRPSHTGSSRRRPTESSGVQLMNASYSQSGTRGHPRSFPGDIYGSGATQASFQRSQDFGAMQAQSVREGECDMRYPPRQGQEYASMPYTDNRTFPSARANYPMSGKFPMNFCTCSLPDPSFFELFADNASTDSDEYCAEDVAEGTFVIDQNTFSAEGGSSGYFGDQEAFPGCSTENLPGYCQDFDYDVAVFPKAPPNTPSSKKKYYGTWPPPPGIVCTGPDGGEYAGAEQACPQPPATICPAPDMGQYPAAEQVCPQPPAATVCPAPDMGQYAGAEQVCPQPPATICPAPDMAQYAGAEQVCPQPPPATICPAPDNAQYAGAEQACPPSSGPPSLNAKYFEPLMDNVPARPSSRIGSHKKAQTSQNVAGACPTTSSGPPSLNAKYLQPLVDNRPSSRPGSHKKAQTSQNVAGACPQGSGPPSLSNKYFEPLMDNRPSSRPGSHKKAQTSQNVAGACPQPVKSKYLERLMDSSRPTSTPGSSKKSQSSQNVPGACPQGSGSLKGKYFEPLNDYSHCPTATPVSYHKPQPPQPPQNAAPDGCPPTTDSGKINPSYFEPLADDDYESRKFDCTSLSDTWSSPIGYCPKDATQKPKYTMITSTPIEGIAEGRFTPPTYNFLTPPPSMIDHVYNPQDLFPEDDSAMQWVPFGPQNQPMADRVSANVNTSGGRKRTPQDAAGNPIPPSLSQFQPMMDDDENTACTEAAPGSNVETNKSRQGA